MVDVAGSTWGARAVWLKMLLVMLLAQVQAGCASYDDSLLLPYERAASEFVRDSDAGDVGDTDDTGDTGPQQSLDGSMRPDASAPDAQQEGLDAGPVDAAPDARRYPPPDELFPLDGSATLSPRDAAVAPADADVVLQDAAAQDAKVDASDSCAPSQVIDYCAALPALPQAPKIDGLLDCGIAASLLPVSHWNGTGPAPTAHTTSFAAAYRPNGLYVYAEVRGQPAAPHPSGSDIYCGDAIGVYVDADGDVDADGRYDTPGTMQFIVAAPQPTGAVNAHARRFVQGTSQGAWSQGAFAVIALADGYAVEAFIDAADLGLSSWTPADSMGLDLTVGVAGSASDPDLRCGLLRGQYFLRIGDPVRDCSGEPWCASTAFCKPALQP